MPAKKIYFTALFAVVSAMLITTAVFAAPAPSSAPELPVIELPPIIMEAGPSLDLAIDKDIRLDIIEIFEV
jgi:hypothetical protein